MNLIQDLREYVRSSLSARRAGARKRVGGWQSSEAKRKKLARPERFELPTYSSGGCRSIQLSYGRAVNSLSLQPSGSVIKHRGASSHDSMPPWKGVLPSLRQHPPTFQKRSS